MAQIELLSTTTYCISIGRALSEEGERNRRGRPRSRGRDAGTTATDQLAANSDRGGKKRQVFGVCRRRWTAKLTC